MPPPDLRGGYVKSTPEVNINKGETRPTARFGWRKPEPGRPCWRRPSVKATAGQLSIDCRPETAHRHTRGFSILRLILGIKKQPTPGWPRSTELTHQLDGWLTKADVARPFEDGLLDRLPMLFVVPQVGRLPGLMA